MPGILFLKSKPVSRRMLIGFVICLLAIWLIILFWQKWERPTEIEIAGERFWVQIAATAARRTKGLSGRVSLAKNEGMLFVFPQPTQQAFWMKDMKFALDIIWIRDNKIVDIASRVSPAASEQNDTVLPVYPPRVEADRVLEVVAGTADRLHLKIGDEIKLPAKLLD